MHSTLITGGIERNRGEQEIGILEATRLRNQDSAVRQTDVGLFTDMKSIVFYYHPKLPRRLISDGTAIWVGDEFVGYVRAELHTGKDCAEALDDAKPNQNEIALNSVELT